MKKGILFLSFFLLVSASARAECPQPTMNTPRSVESTLQQIEDFIIQKYEELSEDTEKDIKEGKSGNQNCSKSPQNTEDKAIKIGVYEYLADNVLTGNNDEATTYLAPTKKYTEARKLVKDKLFQPAPPQLTDRGKKLQKYTGINAQGISSVGNSIDRIQVLIRRDNYANAVASKNLDISTKLREKIVEDIASTQKAETDGCNQLQGLVLENRNLGALIAETASDIVIQILTLESLGVRNLQKEEVDLVPLPQKEEDASRTDTTSQTKEAH